MGNAVFRDPTGRRAISLQIVGWFLSISIAMALAYIVSDYVITQPLADEPLPNHLINMFKPNGELPPGEIVSAAQEQSGATTVMSGVFGSGRDDHNPAASGDVGERPLSIAFYVNEDEASFAALDRALPRLDWIVPTWLSMAGADMEVRLDVDRKLIDQVNRSDRPVSIVPVIQNLDESGWQGDNLARLVADKAKRSKRLATIVKALEGMGASGLVLDFESVPAEAQADLQRFVREIAATFRSKGWKLVIALPFDDASWDYAAYASLADYVLLMAYDEHWDTGEPGSISGQAWFDKILATRMQVLPRERTIVALGNYGYEWSGSGRAESIGVPEALRRAHDARARIVFDPVTRNPHFEYLDAASQHRDVWFLDAVTTANQIRSADAFRPAGYALWRLGFEDPSVWAVMGQPYGTRDLNRLRAIPPVDAIAYVGGGEILRVLSQPSPGRREITFATDGTIADRVLSRDTQPLRG